MSKLLSQRQAEELHKSVIAYLSSINATQSKAILREELQVSDNFTEDVCKKYERLLERKWTGVARMQKRIMDLESKVMTLEAELKSASAGSKRVNRDPKNWLPESLPKHTFEAHRGSVTSVAFHPILSLLASGAEDCTIKIWDWELGELDKTLKAHTRTVTGLDFGGQKGRILLASCSNDLTIKIWDPNNNYANVRTLLGHDHSVSSVRFLVSTGNRLVSASRDATLRIWDVTTGSCIRTIRTDDWVRDVFPSFDGKWLVSCGREKAVTIWEVSSREASETLVGHENEVECCAFAPPPSYRYLAAMAGLRRVPPASSSAEFVATGARDKLINLWDSRGSLIKTLEGHDNWVRGLVFHPSGKYLLSVGDDKTIRCWDLSQEGRLVKTIGGVHQNFVNCIRWAPHPADVGDTSNMSSLREGQGRTSSEREDASFRCIIATGSVDSSVRIFM